MDKPNLFIIGAPKCATTAITNFLASQPNVFMCEPKEPHFFSSDFPRNQYVKTTNEYLKLFRSAKPTDLIRGEASVWYIYSSYALEAIKQFNPDAKIIISIRNPIEMVYSLHSENLYTANENIESFEEAWTAQERRARGLDLPKNCRNPVMLQYAELGRYSRWIERAYSIFGQEKVKVVLFDDLIKDQKRFCQDILEFLSLPSGNSENFPSSNKNKVVKSRLINHFLQHPPEFMRSATVFLRKSIGIDLRPFALFLRRLNTKPKTRNPLSDNLKSELSSAFLEDICFLEGILAKDLSKWKRIR